jgi:hypothetical protein
MGDHRLYFNNWGDNLGGTPSLHSRCPSPVRGASDSTRHHVSAHVNDRTARGRRPLLAEYLRRARHDRALRGKQGGYSPLGYFG